MKRYIIIFIALVITGLISSTSILYIKNKRLNEDMAISRSNEKAFIQENSELKDNSRVLQFTIEQLNYYNDSLLEKMNEVRQDLNIKNKNLKQLQYLLSEAEKKDSIVFKDTLFREPTLNIDTIIGDEWYKLELGLRYPGTIIANPKFISEKYIVTSAEKETINPPKKCWLLRLFQKKHTVLKVSIVEKNPYIESKQQRFVEIIK